MYKSYRKCFLQIHKQMGPCEKQTAFCRDVAGIVSVTSLGPKETNSSLQEESKNNSANPNPQIIAWRAFQKIDVKEKHKFDLLIYTN